MIAREQRELSEAENAQQAPPPARSGPQPGRPPQPGPRPPRGGHGGSRPPQERVAATPPGVVKGTALDALRIFGGLSGPLHGREPPAS